ncbi:ARM repeat-containing protein [Multifurca ochricompacta]|uniref:ARM repeat-containing protein n=1 Tax=Multifurca ochricompacta TaxID=376703 RepID=A0AAD4MBG0_9AGAM|nr:ARM repeat-containing protein [Multifurca ochricompacta]
MNSDSTQVAQHASLQEVYAAVVGAVSQNPKEMSASAARLKDLIDQPGTLALLQQIAAQKTAPLHIRQLSIIQVKNVVSTHWRSRRLVPDDQRPNIRDRCLTLLDEEDDVIGKSNEVIIAKIARSDFPHKWASLESDIMTPITRHLGQRLSSQVSEPNASLILHKSLRALNAILKELSHIKMMTSVKTLGQLITRIHAPLSEIYVQLIQGLGSSIVISSLTSHRTAEDLLFAHLLYKIIMKMAVWIWPKLRDPTISPMQQWFNEVFQYSAVQLRGFYETRISLLMNLRSAATQPNPIESHSLNLLFKYVRTFGKFFRRVQQLDVVRFVELPLCDDLILYYWDKVVEANSSPELIEDTESAVFPVRVLVLGMVLFKESLAQWAPARKPKAEHTMILSQGFVETAVTFLVTRFMPLNPNDLEGWMANPEEWVNAEDKDDEQWQFEIRPCAERVLMTLANQYHEFVTPLLVKAFVNVNERPPAGLQDIVQKEAVYCAVGRCAHRLRDDVDFSSWLEIAQDEAKHTGADYLIIQRRVVWLIGRWVSEDCYPPTDPRIWQILLHLLRVKGPGAEVVQLTTATALQQCVAANLFDLNVFVPFLVPAVAELLQLIDGVDTVEMKSKLAACLNTVIDRSGTEITSSVSLITSAFPRLWVSAGGESHFKITLLRMMTVLITATGQQSNPLATIVVPLLQECLSPAFITELETDALHLWITALRNATALGGTSGEASLLDLFPKVISLLVDNCGVLGSTTDILEGYLLLDANAILQRYASQLFSALKQSLITASANNARSLLDALALLLQLAHPSTYSETLHSSGLFSFLIMTITEDKADVFILTRHVEIMARLAVWDSRVFLQYMSAAANRIDRPESELWEGLLDQWRQRFDNVSEPRHRKLYAMGLAALVSTGRPEVLSRLPGEVFDLWTDVFAELKEVQRQKENDFGEETTILTAYWDQPAPSFFNGSEDTPEYERRKNAYDMDPVRTILLSSFIAERLREAEVACGGTQVMQNHYLSRAEPPVLQHLMREIFGA